MTYLKIGGQEFELEQLYSVLSDAEWQNRNAYFAKIRSDYETAKSLFIDNAVWSTYAEGKEEEDRSDYCIAGKIIDYRNGSVGVYMGRKTESEKMEDENQRVLPLIQTALPTLPDAEALEYIKYFKSFDELVEDYATEEMGFRFQHNGLLWKLMQPSYTFDGLYVPGEPGTESLFARVTTEEEGTHDNPIVYDGNMELFNGKYYTQDEVLYLCFRDTGAPVYNRLDELVGLYVEVSE